MREQQVTRPPSSEALLTGSSYSGVDNLEAMEVAHNYRRYLAGLIRHAASASPSGLRVLDFGAGVGTYARLARELGFSVDCVEIDVELAARLRNEGFSCASDMAAFGDETFDVVYTLNVLEHLADDRGALVDMCRVLKPGGRLLVYVPAFNVLYSDMDRLVGHLRRYRRSDLIQVVKQSGFRPVECYYVDSLGFVASLAYRSVGGSGSLTARSVATYDKWIFPASRVIDHAAKHLFGKNIALLATRDP